MSVTPPLDIKVIYSASTRRRRGRRIGGSAGLVRTLPLAIGVLNLVAAGALYYGTWWRVDRFLYMKLMWKTPISGLDARAASGFLVPKLPGQAREEVGPATGSDTDASTAISARATGILLGATAYGWLTLATVAYGALALAAGAAIGGNLSESARRIATVGAVLVLTVIVIGGLEVFRRFGWHYPVGLWRTYMFGPAILGLFIGLGVVRRAKLMTRIAALAVILSGVGSVVGLYFGSLCEALEPSQASAGFIFFVFMIHSAWGWVQLALAGYAE